MLVSPTINSVHGRIRSITGTDPAAGAEISETVPDRRRWKLTALHFTLITDANAADRYLYLIIDDGTKELFRILYADPQTASETKVYNYTQQLAAPFNVTVNIFLPLPQLALGSGYRIRTSTTNIQAGDNYNAPQLLVEEWIDP